MAHSPRKYFKMKKEYIKKIVNQSINELDLTDIPNGIKDQLITAITTRIHDQNGPLNRKECAVLLGVSLPTLDRYIKEEDIPFRLKNSNPNQRNHYVFYSSEVLEWYQSRLSDLRVNIGRSA